jgi:hypothetical protein
MIQRVALIAGDQNDLLAGGFGEAYHPDAFLVRLVRTMPLGIRKTNQERELPRRDGATVAVSRDLEPG